MLDIAAFIWPSKLPCHLEREMRIRRKRNRIILFAFAALALVLTVLLTIPDFGVVCIPFYGPALMSGWQSVPFNARSWRGQCLTQGIGYPMGRNNLRARMVNDVLSNHLHVGMTKAKVDKLLGEGDCGGGGDGEYVEIYGLMTLPSADQKVMAWFRWRTADPQLVLDYRFENGRTRLMSARIRS